MPDAETCHWGLGISDYTHASSPLRRYADLYNQRCLIEILEGIHTKRAPEELCCGLNLLGKSAKAFERDMFFLKALTTDGPSSVEGKVLDIQEEKLKLQIWVPTWNRVVRVPIVSMLGIELGQTLRLSHYVQYQNARWKDKIIFSVKNDLLS